MRILITGGDGLVGCALRHMNTPHEMIFVGRRSADLTNEHAVARLYKRIQPDWVIHTAAKVGGIGANSGFPGEYYYENSLMNNFMIHYAMKHKVEKLLAFSSVCVFPDGIPVLREDLMHAGEPASDHFSYAAAKRCVDVMIRAYKKQYGVANYTSIISTNIFGEFDLYKLETCHVLPALIHKIYLAKKENKPLHVWGNGSAEREFIYSMDMAKILMKVIELDDIPERLIVSNPKAYTIKEMVEKLCKAANFTSEVIWQTDKPNGQPRRPTDLSLLKKTIGDYQYEDMDIAIAKSYNWFESKYPNVRM